MDQKLSINQVDNPSFIVVGSVDQHGNPRTLRVGLGLCYLRNKAEGEYRNLDEGSPGLIQ